MSNPITSNEDLNNRMKELLGIDTMKELNENTKENDTMSKFATPKGLNVNVNNTASEMPSIPTIPTIPNPQAVPQTANVIIGQPTQQNQVVQEVKTNTVPIMNMPINASMPTIPVENRNVIEEPIQQEEPEENIYANQQYITMAMPQVIIEEKEKKSNVPQVETLNYDEIHRNLMANYKTMSNEDKFREVLKLASKGGKRVKTPGTLAAYIGKSVNSRRVLNAVNGKPMDGYKTQKAIEFFWTNETLLKEFPDVLQNVVQLDLFSWKNPEKK